GEACARVVLVGDPAGIGGRAEAIAVRLDGVEIAEPRSDRRAEAYADIYHDLTRAKGVTREEARRRALEPLTFAALTVRAGDADGCVAGAVHTTAETMRAALRVVGPGAGVRTFSSFVAVSLPGERREAPGSLFVAGRWLAA